MQDVKPTIYDIAQAAGVSTATVSKVLNNTGRISEKTRRNILRIIEEMDYQPSIVASALTGKKTHTIGLLLPDLANPYFSEIARNIEDRGHDHGFSVIICSTDNKPEKVSHYISILRQKRVDGIIIATGVRDEKVLKELNRRDIPFALIARELPMLAAHTVLVDDFMGGYLAASHLAEWGHRKIAIIAEDLQLTSSKERVRGWRSALEEHGITCDEKWVVIGDFTVEGGKRAMHRLLDLPDRPTAVFACNDLLAIGSIQAARERGLSVPDDVSVVGFDNTILATIIDPPLTTVAQPIREIGRQVMDLLVREIEERKQVKQRVVLLPELIIRQSTKRLAPASPTDGNDDRE